MPEDMQYFTSNPDPEFGVCRVNGLAEAGVSFLGIEPLYGVHTFIGCTALEEAYAMSKNLTRNQLQDRVGAKNTEIEKLRARNKELEIKLEEYSEIMDDLKRVVNG